MFIAGIVVSLMTLPIVASVVREVFAQTPPGEKEAALALGGTRWGMIRTVVLPFGRGGIIGGSMLGLGRALGETIAVALLLPQVPVVSHHILQNGGATVVGLHHQPGRGRQLHRLGPDGRRPRAVRHHAGHQHGGLGGRSQSLWRRGRPVTATARRRPSRELAGPGGPGGNASGAAAGARRRRPPGAGIDRNAPTTCITLAARHAAPFACAG